MKSSIFIVLVMLSSISGFAGVYLTDTIEYNITVGNGTNSATIVIDFDLDNYFLFTYFWDETATGWDALDALESAGDLVVGSTTYSWGEFVYDFDYPGGVEHDYGSANQGWAYYVSEDNETWASSGVGVSDRQLSDGVFDSWVWSNYPTDWSAPIRQPGQAPVPEPATVAFLALGGLLLRRKK